MLIIGSLALRHNKVALTRDTSDIDVIMRPSELSKFKLQYANRIVTEQKTKNGIALFISGIKPVDIEIALPGSTGEQLLEIIESNNLLATLGECEYFDNDVYYASNDLVYTLKMSHRYLRNSPSFNKTMDDIHALRALGCSIPGSISNWYKDRVKATYDYKHPSLKRSKENFFKNDGVNYIYDHDSIHEAVAIDDRPAFELVREEGADIFCSKEKFFSMPIEVQLSTVLEEAYVLALERSLIPYDFTPDPKAAFLIALEKICTSIASGWWREFAWENYNKLVSLYDDGEYVYCFNDALKNGLIRPYNSTQVDT
jgi:hypothetical protein